MKTSPAGLSRWTMILVTAGALTAQGSGPRQGAEEHEIRPGAASSNPHRVRREPAAASPHRVALGTAGAFLLHFFAERAGLITAERDPALGDELFGVNRKRVTKVDTMVAGPGNGALSLWAPFLLHAKALVLTIVGQGIVRRQADPARGTELVRVNSGTAKDVVELVKDINPGPASSYPWPFVASGARVFFTANDGKHGRELWVTQGTAGTTRLVEDIMPGSGSATPHFMTPWRGKLVFAASDNFANFEPWISDGTAAGTKKLKEIRPGSSGSNPTAFVRLGDRIFFGADDGTNGAELWVSDGTPAGTKLFKDIAAGAGSSRPDLLMRFGNGFVFRADDGKSGTELWFSDGTAAGTVRVEDIFAGSGSSNPAELTQFGNGVLFTADDGTHGSELWFSDGTAKGTRLVKDIRPGSAGSSKTGLVLEPIGSRFVWFAADDGRNGAEPWITDGTAAGTYMVADIEPGKAGSAPADFFYNQGRVYYAATSTKGGRELWSTETGAVAVPAGAKCGTAWLFGTDPVLGGASHLHGRADATVVGGLLYLGTPAPAPIPLGHGCATSLWLPLIPVHVFAGGGGYSAKLPIPNDPNLKNLELMLQGIHLNPRSPGGRDLTQGIELWLGF